MDGDDDHYDRALVVLGDVRLAGRDARRWWPGNDRGDFRRLGSLLPTGHSLDSLGYGAHVCAAEDPDLFFFLLNETSAGMGAHTARDFRYNADELI